MQKSQFLENITTFLFLKYLLKSSEIKRSVSRPLINFLAWALGNPEPLLGWGPGIDKAVFVSSLIWFCISGVEPKAWMMQ